MNTQKGFINIILAIVVFILTFAGTYFAMTQQIPSYTYIKTNSSPIACTQEAKQCADGSYVSRTGPNCEFTACPNNPSVCAKDVKLCPNGLFVRRISPGCEFKKCGPAAIPPPPSKQITLKEGQQEASLLVQRIYPTYITGLNFREYPVATNQGEPISLYIGQSASNGCTITLTLISIESDGQATFTEKTDFNKPCPICLAKDTLIDTPDGQIPVQQLQKGMSVWTVDIFGKRIATTIIKTSKTPVPKTHYMVRIILEDGREILASPEHPTGDRRIFDNLSVGEFLDGSRIVTAEKTSYDKGYTYDILPSGATGFYVANKILIDSTLH